MILVLTIFNILVLALLVGALVWGAYRTGFLRARIRLWKALGRHLSEFGPSDEAWALYTRIKAEVVMHDGIKDEAALIKREDQEAQAEMVTR